MGVGLGNEDHRPDLRGGGGGAVNSEKGTTRLFLIFLWVQLGCWAAGFVSLGVGLAIFKVIPWGRLLDVLLLCVEVWCGGFAILLLSLFVPIWLSRKGTRREDR